MNQRGIRINALEACEALQIRFDKQPLPTSAFTRAIVPNLNYLATTQASQMYCEFWGWLYLFIEKVTRLLPSEPLDLVWVHREKGNPSTVVHTIEGKGGSYG